MTTLADGLLDIGFVGRGKAGETVERMAGLAARFAARAEDNDLAGRFPVENFQDLHAEGLMAVQVPAEYGGAGLTPLEYCAAIAALAAGDASTALAYNMHSTALVSIGMLASEEQKGRWYGRVVRDGARVAALGSEQQLKPFIDGAPPQTRLTPSGDGYRLTGQKTYCSFGPHADLLYVVATLGEGLAFAVVDAHAPGVERRDDWKVMSMRSTESVTTDFRDVFVPREDIVLPPDSALAMMLEIEFALGYGPIYLAVAAASCAHAVRGLRGTLGGLLATAEGSLHPDVGLAFAGVGKASTLIESAWLMCQKAAQTNPLGSFGRAAAIVAAKAVACDAACEAAELALRLSGGRALGERSVVGRAFRDVQAGQVMAFSPAQARYMIGRLILGYAPEYIDRLRAAAG
jgi:alkylation response protein AidB-like acyl-CoA dehydrogenase